MGELFGIGAAVPVRLSLRFREPDRARGYREEGWGVGAMQGRAALTIKEPASRPDPATAQMLAAGRALRGEGALAYIRRWTHSASLANCHPFVRELGGREWAFAHNGNVSGLLRDPEWVPRRFRPVGTTDSEYAFCVLLEALAASGAAAARTTDGAAWAAALADALRPPSLAIARHGMFNYVLLGERCLVAFSSGEYGLYARALEAAPPLDLVDEDWCIGVAAEAPAPCVLAASNPMDGGKWRRLRPGEMIVALGGVPVGGPETGHHGPAAS